ncbi:TPA: microcin [Yersinia enterocolitica]|nr:MULTISPECIES: microcin [Yersinia]EKN3569499.1 microcin [Yersinia enterocolitica]EKN4095578.1 microcin [Yersinia enterocolitica]EKN4839021.1 microcin [Yersinia enterocolitica]ELI8401166.1 microcin [Yersinia enterocolitica]ELY5217757.1 microcin [Yersinia enterocolitica]
MMKEISDNNILLQISGAGDSNNSAIAGSFGKDVAWGIGTGLITGGPGGAVIGAGVAATQNVIQGAINHGPVNVPIPTVPMGPTWNGSRPYADIEYQVCKMTGGPSC